MLRFQEASEELEREIDAGRDEVRERNVLVEELREQITQLRACVHAERFLNIPIRPADTEYPQVRAESRLPGW